MQTKLVLDKKWGVFYNGNVEMTIRLKASWNAPIFESGFKKWFFVCKRSFKAWNAPKYWRVYQMDLTTAKYDVSAFTGKNNFWFLIKIEFCEKKWIWMKKWNFEQKNSFFIKFQKSTKNGQKKFNFFKKNSNFVLL